VFIQIYTLNRDHGITQTCHIERSIITAVWIVLRMFLNFRKLPFQFVNVKFCLSRCDRAWTAALSMNILNRTNLQRFNFGRSSGILRSKLAEPRGIMAFPYTIYHSKILFCKGISKIFLRKRGRKKIIFYDAGKNFPKYFMYYEMPR
jgi:hypothetical protein